MIRRLMGGVGANIFDKLVVTCTQLAMVPVMAGTWGLHLYGLWVLMFTAPSFLAMGDFGFAQAAGTKMTMAVARGQRDEAVHIFQSAWMAILSSSALLLALTAALALLLPAGVFGSDPGMAVGDIRLTLFLLMFYGIAAIQGSIFFAAFRAAGMFAVGAFWNALIILIESGALIAAVLMGASPVVAAATILCGRLVGLAGQNVLLRWRVPWLRIGFARATLAETRSLFAPAGAVMLVPIAQAFYLQGTALALGVAAGQAAVPAFTAVRTLSRIGLQMCWLVNTPLMPEFSSAHASGDRRAQAMMVLATIAVSTVLIVPYALLFGVLAQPIVTMWTHGVIHSSQSLIWVMAGGILFGGFWFPLSNLILALNRHASYTGWFVLLAGCSLPLTYVLAQLLGPTGAGLSMLTLDVAMFVLIAILARRILLQPGELRAAVSQALRRLRYPFARSEASPP
jgi:O-antigen/teichoic acid export membrane protein